MSQQKLSLYALSGVVRDEAFLDSQLQIAGSNQSRILEQLKKTRNSVKHQAAVVKIVYGVLIGILAIMPAYMYFQVASILGTVPAMDSIYVISALLITITSGMTFMYMLILGMISLSGFMSGDVFEWMEVLPLSQRNLQKVAAIVLWRFFDIPLIVQMAAFPVIMTILTGNIVICLTCLVATALNTVFIFCILILIVEKFSRIIKGGTVNSRKATIVRTLTMLGYAIVVVSASLVLNAVMQNMGNIITSVLTLDNPGLLNFFLSLIPFPFAPAYLVSLVMIPSITAPSYLMISTLVGIIILVLLVWLLYRRVLRKLRNLTSHQARVAPLADQKRSSQVETRPIRPVAPVKAYMRKDLSTLTRDIQGMIYLFMPILMPFVMFLQAAGSTGSLAWTGSTMGLFGYLLIYLIMITAMNAGMLISGVFGIEDSGASIMAALPVVPRDQLKAKIQIIGTVNLISLLLPMVILAGVAEISLIVPYFLCFSLVGMTILFLTMALKVRLFGKMRYKYVIEDVNIQRKALKWVAIIGLDAGLLVGLWFLVFFMGDALTGMGILLIFAGSGAGGLVAVLWWLQRMFPKIPSLRQEV